MATGKWKLWLKSLVLLSCPFSLQVFAQDAPQVQPASFLRANDKFSMELLRAAHEKEQDRNIVIAPLSVSLTFAALWDATTNPESKTELAATLRWENGSGISLAGRMLLIRFGKPAPYPRSLIPKDSFARTYLRQFQSGKPEELWISGTFLYRREGSLSQEFMDRVKYDFGFMFRAVDESKPQSKVLARNWDSSLPMPAISKRNDFWITTFTHLRTSWAGNTFLEAKREKHDFRLRSGDVVQADFLKSEFGGYPYVRTDEFEAVELSCLQASIILVLPTPEKDIAQLEAAFSKNPDLVEPLLARRLGDVQLPPFHFVYEADLRNSLKKMGVHRIFSDPRTLLSMAPSRAGGTLGGVAQKTEITVDENGIRADAGTIAHGAYGGILTGPSPFHINLNRPFLFIIRDNVTHALLFAGVVMNPTLQ